MSNTPMTAGQMKQLISKVLATVPSDLTFEEVSHILSGHKLHAMLKEVWSALRSHRVYKVVVPSDAWSEITRQELAVCDDRNDESISVEEVITYFTSDIVATSVGIEIFDASKCPDADGYLKPAEVRRHIAAEGYRPADVRELVALITQHPMLYQHEPYGKDLTAEINLLPPRTGDHTDVYIAAYVDVGETEEWQLCIDPVDNPSSEGRFYAIVKKADV